MGIFSGCLICTDLDDTLLTSDKKVSDKNIEAIEYFKSEGGLFTFATGRIVQSAKHYIDIIKPNAPVIVYNGCAIYDWEKEKIIYKAAMSDDAIDVVRFIISSCDFSSVQIVTEDKIYIYRENQRMKDHISLEKAEYIYANPESTVKPWIKVLCTQERDEVDKIRQMIANSEYATKFSYTQSSPYYYEILPKDVTKGGTAQKLREILGIANSNFFAVGDNENDMEMLRLAGTGFAVQNASDKVKTCADVIAPHHNDDVMAWVVDRIKNMR